MAYTLVHAVRDLIYAFIADDLGELITAICVLGVCLAMFFLLRRGAGGGR